jgi:hypothetical protein
MLREQCFSLWGKFFQFGDYFSKNEKKKKHKKSFVLLKDFSAIF